MKETRYMNIRAEKSADNNALILTGRAVIYEAETIIYDTLVGEYKEVIKRGALDSADLSDVRLLYNHDTNKIPLARTPKTLKLTVDNEGLLFEAVLPDTEEARAVYKAVERGDLSGCSFAFTTDEDGDIYDAKTNTRTISKINKIYECSVVVFPAYQETSVEARSSILATQKNYKAKKDLIILANKIIIGA